MLYRDFQSELVISPMPDGLMWKLETAFIYRANNGQDIEIPEGFITDFASIPRLFWNILPPWGKYGKAAVLHDWVYRKHLYPRNVCDKLLREAMTQIKTPKWQRIVIYYAVRGFGWWAYRHEPKN